MSHRGRPVLVVLRRSDGELRFVPWTIVAPSDMLRRIGAVSSGLYAARSFQQGDVIGLYPQGPSDVVGHFATREEALAAPRTRRRLMRGRDKLVTTRNPHGKGVLLLDGQRGGGAEVPRANDPRGTGLRANCVLTEGGYLRVTARRVPAFVFDAEDNSASELRISYGDDFWALHDVLGTSREHAIVVG